MTARSNYHWTYEGSDADDDDYEEEDDEEEDDDNEWIEEEEEEDDDHGIEAWNRRMGADAFAAASQNAWFQFDHECRKLQANDPTVTTFDTSEALASSSNVVVPLSDTLAQQLAQSLVGNTHLNELTIHMSTTHGPPNNVTYTTAQALARGIQQAPNLHMLVLEGNGELGIEVAPLYTETTSVERLQLLFPMNNAHATKLSETLQNATSSSSLHRLTMFLGPAMTNTVTETLARALRHSKVHTLELLGSSTTPQVHETARILYQQGIPGSSIVLLNLFSFLGDWQALVTHVLPHLLGLTIQDVSPEDELTTTNMSILANALLQQQQQHGHHHQQQQLKLIRFGNCNLTHAHMQLLAPAVGHHPTLRKLDLMGNPLLGDDALLLFLEHWQDDSKLLELHLTHNHLGVTSVQQLLRAVRSHRELRGLYVGHNPKIGYDGLVAIGNELLDGGQMMLQVLDVSHVATWIDHADPESKDAKLQMTKCTRASQALLEGVRANVHLHELRLSGVRLVPHILAELQVYLQANRCGRSMVMTQDQVPSGLWPYVFAKPANQTNSSSSVLYLLLCELVGVVMGRP